MPRDHQRAAILRMAKQITFFGKSFTLDTLEVTRSRVPNHFNPIFARQMWEHAQIVPFVWEIECRVYWQDWRGDCWMEYDIGTFRQAARLGYTWDWRQQSFREVMDRVNPRFIDAFEARMRIIK